MIKPKIWRICVANILFLQLIAFPISSQLQTDIEIPQWTQSDLTCLMKTIHYEARGEQTKGKIAVAHVVLNRTDNKRFPDSICGVVRQKTAGVCQFSWNCVKYKTKAISEDVYMLAVKVLNGETKDPTKGALFFHNRNVENFNRKKIVEIGNHIFYK